MKPKPLLSILTEFYAFVFGRLAPMLAAWPVWSLRIRKQRGQVKHDRVRRGNPKRNPTALR